MIILDYSWFKPDTERLVGCRKAIFQVPLALVCWNTSRFPFIFSTSPIKLFVQTLSSIIAFLVETFISNELVAVLAVSCAWLFNPHAEIRLRAGLPPPPWLKAWLLLFKVMHWCVVNAMYAKFGNESGMVPLRGAFVMWGVAIMIVLTMVAAFVGKAMVRNALDDMQWRKCRGK